MTERCKRCGRKLKDLKSIERGYGSCCYKLKDKVIETKIKYGWFK
jgi:protein-arginine kinase activator protein McsA